MLASGLYSHVLYTGLVGMGIGYVVSRRSAVPLGEASAVVRRVSRALAVFGHFLWNSPLLDLFPAGPWSAGTGSLVSLATAVKGLPLLVFVAVAVRPRARARAPLAPGRPGAGGRRRRDLGRGAPVAREPARAGARPDTRCAGVRAAARRSLLHRLQREQVNLAMIRSRVATDDDPALLRQRAYCRSLRDALQAMPGAAPADAGAGPPSG